MRTIMGKIKTFFFKYYKILITLEIQINADTVLIYFTEKGIKSATENRVLVLRVVIVTLV